MSLNMWQLKRYSTKSSLSCVLLYSAFDTIICMHIPRLHDTAYGPDPPLPSSSIMGQGCCPLSIGIPFELMNFEAKIVQAAVSGFANRNSEHASQLTHLLTSYTLFIIKQRIEVAAWEPINVTVIPVY